MKKGIGLLLAVMLLLSLLPVSRGESSSGKAELVRVCDGESNEWCLAANTDGTRFLIYQNIYPECSLWVQDADGGNRQDLYFSGLSEDEAEALAGLTIKTSMKLNGTKAEKKLEDMKRQYGSAVEVVMHTLWQQPVLYMTTVAGNWVLLCDTFGYARINMLTGETVLLYRLNAAMGPDGSVFCYETGQGKTGRLAPDKTVPAETAFLLPNYTLFPSGCLLSDGTFWMVETVSGNVVEQDDHKYITSNLSLVLRDENGNELRRIQGGTFDYRALPNRFLYSESAGTGIVYSDGFSPYQLLWTFGPEDTDLKALLPAGPVVLPNLPALNAVSREEAVNEYGYPVADSRYMRPLGLSADGKTVLILDMQENRLMSADIRTLEARILMTGEQISNVLNSKTNEPIALGPASLQNTCWNGGDFLCGRCAPAGYVLRLPAVD